ncbi:MAG: bifunctional folylpolyglutamate synthase/dihydrofolate synthase [Bacteroidales bacterium]|nr:bifunctional folylpolyglutamate synthase/dihydrofolate synthase [Bacteroidales bacterium]
MYDCLPMFHRIGMAAYKANLDNTHALSNLTGKPEVNFPSIHIAGTNGKGSVSHMLASILQESGYKTGLYTSPHLKDFRERIRINGKMISKSRVVAFVTKYKKDFETINPSFFEMAFAIAMEYFSENKVDIAVVETGMGGRLDSTNIIRSILSVITYIGFDHTQFLGDTLKKIAVEKAGIIKSGVPVIIGKTQHHTKDIFEQKALEKNTEICFADNIYKVRNFNNGNGISFESIFDIYRHGKLMHKSLHCALGGSYQTENIQTVFAGLEHLIKQGYKILDEAIFKGLKNVVTNTGLQGRWQLLANKPLTICDTGHNHDGIKIVVRQLKKMKLRKLHIVFGMVNDKDISGILKLLPKDAVYYFCKADIPRGLDASILKSQAESFCLQGEAYNSVKHAYKEAMQQAHADDVIFIGGSIFVVAEVV